MSDNRKATILFEKNLLTGEQLKKIKEHTSLGIFSLHNEIRFFLFLAVLLFTSGAGIFIYQNIDSIGHVTILGIIFFLTVFCFYYSFRHAGGFSRNKTESAKPIYDHMVLSANLLSGIFIGYLQFQYGTFGTRYGLATLVPTLLYFFSAYYFDHKGVLSLGISGLFATLGFSTNPEAVLDGNFSGENYLGFSVIALCFVLILYTLYADKKNIKVHFNTTFLNFSLHISSIVVIANLFSDQWILYFLLLAAILTYFIYLAYQTASVSFMVFSLIYAYITFNILLSKFTSFLELYTLMIYLSPFYFVGSILLFRKLIKDFKHKTKHAGI